MSRDNKDRYGYRHRADEAHDLGDSKPGDVGDSKGTFHDRAREDNNVIVGDKVRSLESHKRSAEEVSEGEQQQSSRASGESVSQDDLVGKTVEVTIDRPGGTMDTLAEYRNHIVHVEGGTPGETRRVRLEEGHGYLIGHPVTLKE